MKVEFGLQGGGLWLLRGVDAEGSAWLEETSPEDAQWFAGCLVVEGRYVEGVLEALVSEGGVWTAC